MEMFVLGYANDYAFTPDVVFKSVRVRLMAQNLLDKPVYYTQILFP